MEKITIEGNSLLLKALSRKTDENQPEEESIILKPLSSELSAENETPEETLIIKPLPSTISEDNDSQKIVLKVWQEFSSSSSESIIQKPQESLAHIPKEAIVHTSQEEKTPQKTLVCISDLPQEAVVQATPEVLVNLPQKTLIYTSQEALINAPPKALVNIPQKPLEETSKDAQIQNPQEEKQKSIQEALKVRLPQEINQQVSQEEKQKTLQEATKEAVQENSKLTSNNEVRTHENVNKIRISQNVQAVNKQNVSKEAKSGAPVTLQTSSRRTIKMPKRFADSIVELDGLPIKTEPPDRNDIAEYDLDLSTKTTPVRKRQKVSHASEKHILEIEDPQLEQVLAAAELQDMKSLTDIKTERKILGYMCSDCRKIYRTENSLKLHKCDTLEKQDKRTTIKIEDEQQVRKKIGPTKGIYECSTCHVQFRDNHVLSRHLQRKGSCGGENDRKSRCLHPTCGQTFRQTRVMLQHVREEHKDINFEEKHLNFPSLDTFLRWKDIEEAKTMTKYVRRNGKVGVKSKTSYRAYYFCIHSGEKNTRPRITSRTHRKGVIKTGLYCPARMSTQVFNDGRVSVSYLSTHTHKIKLEDTQHYGLSESVVRYIQNQLTLGVPEKKIQENLRKGYDDTDARDENGEAVRRQQEVSLWLISDVGRKRNIPSINALIHAEDGASVEMLVSSLEQQDFNPVITYKPLGGPVTIGAVELNELPFSDNLFAVGLQTRQQLDIMRGGDTRVLCVDTTYCKKQYEIFLFSFLLPDGYGKGYPVAHFLTNHQDERTLHYLFSSLKERCRTLKISAVMTDDSKSGSNAHKGLSYVLGETRHLLCHSYLGRLWKWRMKMSCKDDKELQVQVITFLSAITQEVNIDFFQDLCNSFIEKYSSRCPQFTENFSKNYMKRTMQWAKCQRMNLDGTTDSIPVCRDLSEKLKSYFKNRKVKRKIHDLMLVLLNFWNDIHVDVQTSGTGVTGVTSNEEENWDNEPFLQTLDFQSEEIQATNEALEELEKLRNYLQHPNVKNHQQMSQNIATKMTNVVSVIKELTEQCEAIIPANSADPTSSETEVATKNIIDNVTY